MTIRFTAKSRQAQTFGVAALPTGFQNVSAPNNLTIPAVGIEDVDVALFKLFNDEIGLTVNTKEGSKVVPVIFASGEKWAMLKRGRGLRDRSGSLILPLVTIGRTTIQQNPADDQAGRGINQQTGELVIRRRLDPTDRAYQSLVNKLLIKNQENAAVNPPDVTLSDQVSTDRSVGLQSTDPTVAAGGLLAPELGDNVWEIITVPAPQFFTAIYEITVWSQYMTQMNEILEGLISSFLPQGNAWRLETDKGYWFVATVDGNLYNPENNFDDMSTSERIIKYKFNIKVPGYILASRTPGTPVPLRRYVSSPTISFGITTGGVADSVDDPFLGADDPTLPLADDSTRTRSQRRDGKTRLYPKNDQIAPDDPALKALPRGQSPAQYRRITGVDSTGREVVKYARIKNVNRFTGETVYSQTDLSDLSIIVIDD